MKKLDFTSAMLGTAFCALVATGAVQAQEGVVAGTVPGDQFSGQTMVFTSSGGILQQGQQEAVWDPFTEEAGVTVLQDTADFNKLRAMVENKNVVWDLFTGNRYLNYQYCGELFEELDFSKIDTSRVPEGLISGECMVPVIAYSDIMVYNASEYDQAPNGWVDFFDVEHFPGKRGVNMSTSPAPGLIIAALIGDGVAPENLYPIDFERAFDKLRSIDSHIVPWSSGAQAQQQLESGEVSMAWVWNGRGYGAAQSGADIKPVWNDWIVAVDALAIPKGAPNPELSYAAINYYLGAEQTEKLTELTSYAPVNLDAEPDISPLAQEWLFNEERLQTSQSVDVDWWVENWDEFNEMWTAWISGY
ncbi:ABC transporter substrate-binding protein [Pelagibacterium lacus]|uniref:ABC transporter substrate-binding protein n=1 Tax=Pelagibacterium lacus TaxID=2282655 RepID=A0A369W6U0_9HYPH|nr:ABC transporter substrate-binding protein [Pelagibacterium lacus]RDE07791.1 ABC transporter substrate-binding protein [Pelagibacterium lacus]